MAITHHILDAEEIRNRAAAVRRNWSSDERRRRTGLPPDIPRRLRQLILGPLQPAWSTASGDPRSTHPLR